MAKRIILFLSELRETAVERDYQCPDGSIVSGRQTNETPVKYILRCHPNTQEIICLVTKEAEASAWEHFQNAVQEVAPKIKITKIPYGTQETVEGNTLESLLKRIERRDEIFLDTTGGIRSTVIQLLLLSRALQYNGIPFSAYYCDLGQKKLLDTTEQYRSFDLIAGLQDLTQHGNVTTLRAYFEGSNDPVIDNFLDAMQELNDAIDLCSVEGINRARQNFEAALGDVKNCKDPIMHALYPVCQEKFKGKLGNARGLINWCLDNNKLQQALTIYTECIPEYLMTTRKNDILSVNEAAVERPKKHPGESVYTAYFIRSFVYLSGKTAKYTEWDYDCIIRTIENLGELLPNSGYTVRCSVATMQHIMRDYLYIRMLRNNINHAAAGNNTETELSAYLCKNGYPRLDIITAKLVRSTLKTAIERLTIR